MRRVRLHLQWVVISVFRIDFQATAYDGTDLEKYEKITCRFQWPGVEWLSLERSTVGVSRCQLVLAASSLDLSFIRLEKKYNQYQVQGKAVSIPAVTDIAQKLKSFTPPVFGSSAPAYHAPSSLHHYLAYLPHDSHSVCTKFCTLDTASTQPPLQGIPAFLTAQLPASLYGLYASLNDLLAVCPTLYSAPADSVAKYFKAMPNIHAKQPCQIAMLNNHNWPYYILSTANPPWHSSLGSPLQNQTPHDTKDSSA